MSTPSKWKHFTVEELQCPCCKVIPKTWEFDRFMEAMVIYREYCDFKWPVTSGYRCPRYNKALTGESDGVHTKGALDINLFGEQAVFIDDTKKEFGVTGFGTRQHGPRKERFIHMDTYEGDVKHPRPWIWTYP